MFDVWAGTSLYVVLEVELPVVEVLLALVITGAVEAKLAEIVSVCLAASTKFIVEITY